MKNTVIEKAILCLGSQGKLASKVGVSQGAVGFWLRCERFPNGKNAREIEVATGGQVKREEIRPDIFA